MTIKIGDAAVGMEVDFNGALFKIVRYVRPGERAEEMLKGRDEKKFAHLANPTPHPRYIFTRVRDDGLFYHQSLMSTIPFMRKKR